MSIINIKNSYSNKPVVAGLDYKAPGSNERMFDNRGQVNASNQKELAEKVVSLMQAMGNGEVATEASLVEKEFKAEANKELQRAFKSESKKDFQAVAAQMTAIVKEYADRDGFMRKFFKQATVDQGNYVKISFDKKVLLALTFDAGGANVFPQSVREARFFPQEFEISLRTFISQIEFFQSSSNFFEEKLNEMKEQIMVQEDKRWRFLADSALGVSNGGNDLQMFSSGFTPTVVAKLRATLDNEGLPPQTMLIASDLLQYVPSFGQGIDIFHQYDLISQGRYGNILGLEVCTDATRTVTQKVLNQGEVYVVAQPEFHGIYTDRAGLVVQEYQPALTDGGRNGKGWMASEYLSMTLVNTRSVVKGLVQ